MLNDELERVRRQIAELKIEEALLAKMLRRMGDDSAKKKPTNRALYQAREFLTLLGFPICV